MTAYDVTVKSTGRRCGRMKLGRSTPPTSRTSSQPPGTSAYLPNPTRTDRRTLSMRHEPRWCSTRRGVYTHVADGLHDGDEPDPRRAVLQGFIGEIVSLTAFVEVGGGVLFADARGDRRRADRHHFGHGRRVARRPCQSCWSCRVHPCHRPGGRRGGQFGARRYRIPPRRHHLSARRPDHPARHRLLAGSLATLRPTTQPSGAERTPLRGPPHSAAAGEVLTEDRFRSTANPPLRALRARERFKRPVGHITTKIVADAKTCRSVRVRRG
jgi:hypothetical protein